MGLDYEKLGFKCGIEIHQQLDTHKLFCSCPSVIREEGPDLIVERRMRAVAGELGEVDPAALHEFLRNRRLFYEAYKDTTCLIELDEEPPKPLNEKALEIALTVALLLKARPVHEVWVMRKTVIDGSNTTGFQRTALIALDGVLETSLGPVSIPSICLEEDAARVIKEEAGSITYRLDRLGIPLVEVATGPEIKNPAHAREVAEKLGQIIRATGKAKRGIGTIRQDINISIAGGERVEVKGVQELRLIAKVIESEVRRQLMLKDALTELRKKGAAKKLGKNFVDVSRVFEKTESKVVRKSLDADGVVLALKLHKLSGLLKERLGPELAEYAKAHSSAKGLFHTDELPAYGISEKEVGGVSEKLGLGEDDAFVIVSEDKKEAEKALSGVLKRLDYFAEGKAVVEETRRSVSDGKTVFMRPLPGADRMYPETDEMPVSTEEYVRRLSKNLPQLPDEIKKDYESRGLSGELASQLTRSDRKKLFDLMVVKHKKLDPTVIAHTLLSTAKEVEKRHSVDASKITEEQYDETFKLISEGVLEKSVIVDVLADAIKNPNKKIRSIVGEKNLESLSDSEIKKMVENIVRQNKDASLKKLVGLVMVESRGKANPKKVMKVLEEVK